MTNAEAPKPKYVAYWCTNCKATGRKRDATMVDWIGGDGTGMTNCSPCGGKGYSQVMPNTRKYWSHGERAPEHDVY